MLLSGGDLSPILYHEGREGEKIKTKTEIESQKRRMWRRLRRYQK